MTLRLVDPDPPEPHRERRPVLIAVMGLLTSDPALAVTPRDDGSGRFVVTHIPTGYLLTGAASWETEEEALEVAKDLSPLFPWADVSEPVYVEGNIKLRQAVREVLEKHIKENR